MKAPTLIVWGKEEAFMESRLARLSLEHCENGALVEIRGAGHWLLHEEPERTSDLMIEFFR